MKGAIVFFSGTSNTEFIAKQFRAELQEKGIECSLIDIRKKKKLNDEYNYFVFAAPIYFDMFPNYFIDWVCDNIHNGDSRTCIVVSTQADEMAAGPEELTNILRNRGFEVLIQDFIKMPNNYYLEGFKRLDENGVIKLKEEAKIKVGKIISQFINGEKDIKKVPAGRLSRGQIARADLMNKSLNWAVNNLTVDSNLCVKCGKCSKNCPTQNIKRGEQITFKSDCISCQRCIHSCPANAFLFKGRKIEQYKI